MVTHGRRLEDRDTRQLLYTCRVSYLRIALHGASDEVHDGLVGLERAFQRTTAGLKALLREAPPTLAIEVAVTVTASNLGQLEALVDLIASWPRGGELGLRLVCPVVSSPAGGWPPAEETALKLRAALRRAQRAGLQPLWEGFPPCLIEELGHQRDEVLRCAAPIYGIEKMTATFPREVGGDRQLPLPCQECLHNETCPGAPVAFLERDGEEALRPVRSVRANSFNFELQEDSAAAGQLGGLSFVIRQHDCPVRRLTLEGPPLRWVLLELAGPGSEIALYRTPTSDFTEATIREIKDKLEQLYLDTRLDAAVLDDFVESIRRLRLHQECRTCPDRPRCPTTFVIDPEPPFQREERWLRKEVSRMRGRVLDVGCGEQRYRDEVDWLLTRGFIEYHGLDPDAGALDRMRQSGFTGTLHQGDIESFEWDGVAFDYLLMLRSFNHLRDLDRSFQVASQVMRPGAQLVICDSPPFALLRHPRQVAYADENAPVGHEHFRNWTSHQVVELLSRFPFRVDIHRPISANTSNQWILKLMRTG
jgi:SAM-dependent methyltransferase